MVWLMEDGVNDRCERVGLRLIGCAASPNTQPNIGQTGQK